MMWQVGRKFSLMDGFASTSAIAQDLIFWGGGMVIEIPIVNTKEQISSIISEEKKYLTKSK